MMTGTYLELHPPARSQYRNPRREEPSGVVVVHSAENVPDLNPPDTGAENVARYIVTRDTPGSYHDLADSDGVLRVMPYEWEAFQDGTGTNPHGYAVSGAFRAAQWLTLPKAWRDACVRNMAKAAADYATWLKATHGIIIPARRINRLESDVGVPGFISHALRDPGRRHDPGDDFPWTQFLEHFKQLTTTTPVQEEDDVTTTLWRLDGRREVWAVSDGLSKTHIPNPESLAFHQALAALGKRDGSIHVIPATDKNGTAWLTGLPINKT